MEHDRSKRVCVRDHLRCTDIGSADRSATNDVILLWCTLVIAYLLVQVTLGYISTNYSGYEICFIQCALRNTYDAIDDTLNWFKVP